MQFVIYDDSPNYLENAIFVASFFNYLEHLNDLIILLLFNTNESSS